MGPEGTTPDSVEGLAPFPSRSILEHAPTPLAACDRQGRVVFANRALASLLGFSPEDLAGTPLVRLVQTHDAPRLLETFRTALAQDTNDYVEARLKGTAGPVWCRARFTKLPGSIGGPSVVGAFEDITDHKGAWTRLHESNERYRLAVDRANDVIFNIDLKGRFTFVNPTACLLTKFSEEELLVMRYRQLIRPDYRDAAEEFYTDQVARRVPSTYYEYPIVTKDGEVLWLGQYVQLILENQQIVSAQAIARDITQRRQAEDALRTSEERLRTVVSRVPIILWAADSAGRLTLCEGRALSELGLGTDPPNGRPVGKVIDDPDLETHLTRARRGDSFRTELSLRGRAFDAWFAPVRDQQGLTSGVIGVAVDVTEQRQLQSRLHQVEKLEALGHLAGGIAHDFNNQLTAVLGYCELLSQTFDEDDPRLDDLREIAKAGRRSATMTEQLLAYGRKQPRRLKLITLNDVIADMESLLRRSIPADVEFHTYLEPSLAPITADPTQIEHVILNLVLNASDATVSGDQIEISTAMVDIDDTRAKETPPMVPGRYVRLEVRDTGHGMDERTRARVFEPFFTTKEPGKGTGLGLSSVYGIVKQSDGHVWVTSKPGQGTIFHICFRPRAEVTTPIASKSRPAEGVSGSETILLVEDDATVRTLARDVLENQGYHVLAAEHAAAALEISVRYEGQIDLLLTDIVMPGMNGRELAQRFREARPATHVMFTTGYAQERVARQHPQPEQLIQKPFLPSILLLRVREVLDGQTPSERLSPSR